MDNAEDPSDKAAKQDSDEPAKSLQDKFGSFDPKLELAFYCYPPLDLLESAVAMERVISSEELALNKQKIIGLFTRCDVPIEAIKATVGQRLTFYEIKPAPGVRVAKIKGLEGDIALILARAGVHVTGPIPGKGTMGIEVPHLNPGTVSIRSLMATEIFQNTAMDLPLVLGKTMTNEIFIADLAAMPHLLIAGATGQGKSVSINAILVSLLYKKHPAELKFVLIDLGGLELAPYRKIERHFLAKLPDEAEAVVTRAGKVAGTLTSLSIEMDQRYALLEDAHVRNLKEYNQKFISRRISDPEKHRFLPFIVLIIDEIADLMAPDKVAERLIVRLAQMGRPAGIHLVISTQRPSVNIITGIIKTNFPSRLAFRVPSMPDSRVILDQIGAEQLNGRGDAVFSNGINLVRLQCAFVDTAEVEKVSDYIGNQKGYATALLLPEYYDPDAPNQGAKLDPDTRDPLFNEAARLIVMHQQGSTSLIQRKLKLGYNRAGLIIDQLEAAGVVGPFEGSKARDVLFTDEFSLEQYLEKLDKATANLSSERSVSLVSEEKVIVASANRGAATDPILSEVTPVKPAVPEKKKDLKRFFKFWKW